MTPNSLQPYKPPCTDHEHLAVGYFVNFTRLPSHKIRDIHWRLTAYTIPPQYPLVWVVLPHSQGIQLKKPNTLLQNTQLTYVCMRSPGLAGIHLRCVRDVS